MKALLYIKNRIPLNVKKTIFSILSIVWLIVLWIEIGTEVRNVRNREIYLLICVLANLALFTTKKEKQSTYPLDSADFLTAILVTLFSAAANVYPVPGNFLLFFLLLCSGFSTICLCLIEIKYLWKKISEWLSKPFKRKISLSPKKLSLIVFFLDLTINLIILICFYPGIITWDSCDSLQQILTGTYSNHHPFWYTMFIKLFFYPVYTVTGNMTAGIITFLVVQILLQSIIFSYTVNCIFRLTSSAKIACLVSAFYVLYPVNAMYASTMWKDIPYSLSILIITVTLANIVIKKHISFLNVIILFFSCLGTGLFRSNGLACLILTLIGILFWKSTRKLAFPIGTAIIICLIATGPLVNKLGVTPNEFIEKFSIPVQQISRVVVDERDLTNDQKNLIESYISLDSIKNSYNSEISDPIKLQIFNEEYSQKLSSDQNNLLKLYIDLGIKYPDEYIKAWIDQTKGYWNGGYSYWVWNIGLDNNQLIGTIRENGLNPVGKTLFWIGNGYRLPFIMLFFSIGLWVWIFLYLMLKAFFKYKATVLCFLPVLGTWLSLLIATPVFSEFRYIYSLFLCMPVFLAITYCSSQSHHR